MVAIQGSTRVDALSGYAFAASACSDHRQQLGEDTAYTYRGIRITAHEVAHTLGCTHDGTRAPGNTRTFTPDALRCPWERGNLMSYVEKGSESMRFSSCCDYDIAQMSWTYEAACLRTNDTTIIAERWRKRYKLPGEFLTRDEQCKLTYPDLVETYYMREALPYDITLAYTRAERSRALRENGPAANVFEPSVAAATSDAELKELLTYTRIKLESREQCKHFNDQLLNDRAQRTRSGSTNTASVLHSTSDS
nr:uncharacterized protein LOC119165400 [Rhipicephalus microplus]